MSKYSDICTAARAGDLAAVQNMVQADPQAVFTTDKYGFNALHEALVADNCGNVNFESVRFLVHAGCPINQISKGSHPRSPLWIAAEFCPDTEIVQFLIDNGADLARWNRMAGMWWTASTISKNKKPFKTCSVN